MGPNDCASAARMAAPVGVVSSPSTAEAAKGTPHNSSAVAGVGMLHSPWAILIRPQPVATGEAMIHSTPQQVEAHGRAHDVGDRIGPLPTSWKCTFSMLVPCTLASASASRVKMRRGRVLLPVVQPAAIDHRQDVVQVPMGMLGLVLDRHLGRPKATFLNFLGHQPAAWQAQRGNRLVELGQIGAPHRPAPRGSCRR